MRGGLKFLMAGRLRALKWHKKMAGLFTRAIVHRVCVWVKIFYCLGRSVWLVFYPADRQRASIVTLAK